jgi:hypothetical protein
MITEPLDEDICAGRHGGNPESVEAGKATHRKRDCMLILHCLKTFWSEGATCDELEQALHLSHQTCSARCADLKRKGLVRPKPLGDGYEKRPTRTGYMAAVLVLA